MKNKRKMQLEVSIELIQSIRRVVNENYFQGMIGLEKYHTFSKSSDILLMLYRRLVSSSKLVFVHYVYSLLNKKKVSLDEKVYSFTNALKVSLAMLNDKDLNSFDEVANNIIKSFSSTSVKCCVCKIQQKYNGQGIVINDETLNDPPFSRIGEWVCSQKCIEKL